MTPLTLDTWGKLGRAWEAFSDARASRSAPLDVVRLFKLRAVVARFGEMDGARWWNTKGQLGRLGAAALRRGFPRTHRFAQARSVFAVAEHRCDCVQNAYQSRAIGSNCVTLWNLSGEAEDALRDAMLDRWIDGAAEWEPFFSWLEALGGDLAQAMLEAGLVSEADVCRASALRPDGETVTVPGTFGCNEDDVTTLALAFCHGSPGRLCVPLMAE